MKCLLICRKGEIVNLDEQEVLRRCHCHGILVEHYETGKGTVVAKATWVQYGVEKFYEGRSREHAIGGVVDQILNAIRKENPLVYNNFINMEASNG
jgi:hypothetical protein